VANFSLFQELKRRNVLRAGVLYAGAVWALSQGFAQLAPIVGAPDWAVRWFVPELVPLLRLRLADLDFDPGNLLVYDGNIHTGRRGFTGEQR
jgi:hypothetical protein